MFIFAQIESHKAEWNVGSRIGSMDKMKHVAGGGDVKVRSWRWLNNLINQ